MKKKTIFRFFIPLIIFVLIIVFLWKGLDLSPKEIPSPLINKPVPKFSLPTLESPQRNITEKDFLGHVSLLNVWATWCITCRMEHPILVDLAKQQNLRIYGLDYKDTRVAAKKWLKEYGNPYTVVLFDKSGRTAIDWGVYGTPETFVIDKKGIIRYKHVGALDPDTLNDTVLPLIARLRSEP